MTLPDCSNWSMIAETLGDDLARVVMTAMPGQVRRVPTKPTKWWEARLGKDHAKRLCELMGGEILPVPSSTTREALVMAALKKGMTMNEAASAYFISERTVRRIAARMREQQHKKLQGELPL